MWWASRLFFGPSKQSKDWNCGSLHEAIVLLSREDMQGCVLSLNQGYTRFKEAFGTDALAAVKIRESAAVALK